MPRYVALPCVLSLAVLLLAACGGGAEPTSGPEPTPTQQCVDSLCLVESHRAGEGHLKGDRFIEGRIVNTGDSPYAKVEVSFTLYDEGGKLLGTCSAEVEDLGPGKGWNFSAKIPGSIADDVRQHEVESLKGY